MKSKTAWNQVQQGNAHVSDGQEGFWSEFPAGTSAQAVLDEYMSTADYTGATGTFTVTARISGNLASVDVGPGGVKSSSPPTSTTPCTTA